MGFLSLSFSFIHLFVLVCACVCVSVRPVFLSFHFFSSSSFASSSSSFSCCQQKTQKSGRDSRDGNRLATLGVKSKIENKRNDGNTLRAKHSSLFFLLRGKKTKRPQRKEAPPTKAPSDGRPSRNTIGIKINNDDDDDDDDDEKRNIATWATRANGHLMEKLGKTR